MRARAFRRPPSGGSRVLDYNTKFLSGFARSQISNPQIPGSRCLAQDPCQTQRGLNPSLPPRRPRTFRRADPKIAIGRPYGLKVSAVFDFLPDLPTIFSKFWPYFFDRFFACFFHRFWDRFGIDFGPIFGHIGTISASLFRASILHRFLFDFSSAAPRLGCRAC